MFKSVQPVDVFNRNRQLLTTQVRFAVSLGLHKHFRFQSVIGSQRFLNMLGDAFQTDKVIE